MTLHTLTFDGSCGPKNPGGTAAYGFTLYRGFENLENGFATIGTGPLMSNNLAEFAGLAAGLDAFRRLCTLRGAVLNVRGDSRLVINVMAKIWKAREGKLYWPAYLEADKAVLWIRCNGGSVSFDWIPRELNTECDDLSKVHRSQDESNCTLIESI
jgi:ribonuclease HI